jgi:N-acetyltransferase
LKKVDEVKSIVAKELGYVSRSPSENGLLPDQTAYLCVYSSKVVGLLVVERIQEGYRLLPLNTDKEQIRNGSVTTSLHGITVNRSQTSEPAIMGIHLLWVHSQYRKSGIAQSLIDTARRKLIYGLVIPETKIAFSSPTQDGLIFAMKYCNNFDSPSSTKSNDNRETAVLVYDCN